MSKAQWKQPALKQAEKKIADREQAIQEAKFWKEQCDVFKASAVENNARYLKAKSVANEYRRKAVAYDYLRSHGVVLMGDEPKHLQGEDMDKYTERHTWNSFSDTATGNRVLRQMLDASFLSSDPAGFRVKKAADNLAKHIDDHIKFKALGRYKLGTDTGSESKEADQKNSGHYTDILRYADRYRVR